MRYIRTYEQLDVLISNIHETSYSVQKLSNHGTNLASNTKNLHLNKSIKQNPKTSKADYELKKDFNLPAYILDASSSAM